MQPRKNVDTFDIVHIMYSQRTRGTRDRRIAIFYPIGAAHHT